MSESESESDQDDYDFVQLLTVYSRSGDINVVKRLLSSQKNYGGYYELVNIAISAAAENGHLKLVKYLLESNDVTTINVVMQYAMQSTIKGGNMNIVKLLLQHGANNYNNYMLHASRFGNIDVVRLMLHLGATNYNICLRFAAMRGYVDIAQLMLEHGANNYNQVLQSMGYRNPLIGQMIIAYRDNDEEMKRYYRSIASRYALNRKHEKMAQRHLEKYEAHRLAPSLSEDIAYDKISQFLYGSRRSKRRSRRRSHKMGSKKCKKFTDEQNQSLKLLKKQFYKKREKIKQMTGRYHILERNINKICGACCDKNNIDLKNLDKCIQMYNDIIQLRTDVYKILGDDPGHLAYIYQMINALEMCEKRRKNYESGIVDYYTEEYDDDPEFQEFVNFVFQ